MTLLVEKLRLAWLVNELLIQFLRLRLTWELSARVPNGPVVLKLCDTMLEARDRRPRWLSVCIDKHQAAPRRHQ